MKKEITFKGVFDGLKILPSTILYYIEMLSYTDSSSPMFPQVFPQDAPAAHYLFSLITS